MLVVALIYGSFTPFIVFAEPYGGIDCRRTGTLVVTCCQDHLEKTSTGIGFDIVTYCTECQVGRGGETGPAGHLHSCSERYIDVSAVEPTPTPTPPVFDTTAPLQGGVLEQLQNDQPPLFGRNEAAVPPTGGIEQPFTTTTPPLFGNIPQGGFGILQESETTPMFGQSAPEGPTLAGEGENIQPMNTTFPTPQPFPPPTPGFKAPQTSIDISPDRAPEDDQDETDDGIEEQPETQQPEEEPSNEGQDTAGPLT